MKTPLDWALMGLATARLTQLVVEDEITEPIRTHINRTWSTSDADSKTEWVLDQVDTIINCHACSSVWAGGAVLTAETTGVGRFLVRVLALSQAALAVKSVIERIDR